MTENLKTEDAVEPKIDDVVDDMSDRTEQTDEQHVEMLDDSAPASASEEQVADTETDTVSDFDWGAAQAIRLAEARRRRKAAVREAMEYVQSIALAILLAVVIMTFVGRSFVVEGASMEPTLHNRERIIVEKVSYRFRAPARGDIIVLRNPWRPILLRQAATGSAGR